MPARPKPPRLWLRPARSAPDGFRPATWIILDRGKHITTGCTRSEVDRAGRELAAYIAQRHAPERSARSIAQIAVSDVLSIYNDDVGHRIVDQRKFVARLRRLNRFFGRTMLSEINGATCRAYAEARGSEAGARRELEDLRAAIEHHAAEGLHREIVRVPLPPKAPSRTRWLTRDEAARLLWTCWRHREIQRGEATKKRPLRHLVRFILIALYTGTRAGAVASASPREMPGRSWVDLERGVFYRLAIGARETNKRQPPVRLPPRLLAHMRRWARIDPGMQHFVEWQGEAVKSVKTGFRTAVGLAKLPGRVTPHTFRHTAATWLMREGVDVWEVAGFLGMSEATLRRVYGHHHPDFQMAAANAIGYRRDRLAPKAEALAEPLAEREAETAKMAEKLGGPGRTRTCNQIVMSEPRRLRNGTKQRKTGTDGQ